LIKEKFEQEMREKEIKNEEKILQLKLEMDEKCERERDEKSFLDFVIKFFHQLLYLSIFILY